MLEAGLEHVANKKGADILEEDIQFVGELGAWCNSPKRVRREYQVARYLPPATVYWDFRRIVDSLHHAPAGESRLATLRSLIPPERTAWAGFTSIVY